MEIAKNIKPSPRGELEITDVNKGLPTTVEVLSVDLWDVALLGWIQALTKVSCRLLSTSKQFKRLQNVQVANLEEIAYRMGYITKEQVLELAQPLKKNEYGQYLLRLIGEA